MCAYYLKNEKVNLQLLACVARVPESRRDHKVVEYLFAVCCSAVQCFPVYCSQGVAAAYCSVLRCVAVCCSVLQCVAVCCSVLLDKVRREHKVVEYLFAVLCSVLQCVAVYCSQCVVAVCCRVLQCVAVCCTQCVVAVCCCGVLHCVAVCCLIKRGAITK